jgi:methionyl aminopeptidase
MVEIKNDEALDAMREAGRVVARCLAAARETAAVGVSLIELDKAAHDVIRQAGATSPFLNYHPSFAPTPFPAVICASVNDAIVHGIPDGYVLRDGDLVSIDCGATLNGWTGDAATASSWARRARPICCSSRPRRRPSRPASPRRCRGPGSAISRTRSAA